jgi:hypothetical protein
MATLNRQLQAIISIQFLRLTKSLFVVQTEAQLHYGGITMLTFDSYLLVG